MPTILGGAFPLPATLMGEKRGIFIHGNDAKAKKQCHSIQHPMMILMRRKKYNTALTLLYYSTVQSDLAKRLSNETLSV